MPPGRSRFDCNGVFMRRAACLSLSLLNSCRLVGDGALIEVTRWACGAECNHDR
jgi:hypothetical protein